MSLFLLREKREIYFFVCLLESHLFVLLNFFSIFFFLCLLLIIFEKKN